MDESKPTIYLDRLLIICPECGKGGMWATPEGFNVAISGQLLVMCANGHRWATSGEWEEKEGNHDN